MYSIYVWLAVRAISYTCVYGGPWCQGWSIFEIRPLSWLNRPAFRPNSGRTHVRLGPVLSRPWHHRFVLQYVIIRYLLGNKLSNFTSADSKDDGDLSQYGSVRFLPTPWQSVCSVYHRQFTLPISKVSQGACSTFSPPPSNCVPNFTVWNLGYFPW